MDKHFWSDTRTADAIREAALHNAELLVSKRDAKETWWGFHRQLALGAVDVVEVELPDGEQCFSVSIATDDAARFQKEMNRQGRECGRVTAEGGIAIGGDSILIEDCLFKRGEFPNSPQLGDEFIPLLIRQLDSSHGLTREFLIEKAFQLEKAEDLVCDFDSRTNPPDLPLVWPLTLRSPSGTEFFVCSFHCHRQTCIPYLEEYRSTKRIITEVMSDGNVVTDGTSIPLTTFAVTLEKRFRKLPAFKRKRRRNAVDLAQQLLQSTRSSAKSVLIFEFHDEEDSHDDEFQEAAHDHFSRQYGESQEELIAVYGDPIKTGDNDHSMIPLSGVFRYAIWDLGSRKLFLALAHEDRETPLWLKLGVTKEW